MNPIIVRIHLSNKTHVDTDRYFGEDPERVVPSTMEMWAILSEEMRRGHGGWPITDRNKHSITIIMPEHVVRFEFLPVGMVDPS